CVISTERICQKQGQWIGGFLSRNEPCPVQLCRAVFIILPKSIWGTFERNHPQSKRLQICPDPGKISGQKRALDFRIQNRVWSELRWACLRHRWFSDWADPGGV